ncbi:MAG: ribosomal RNA small subunit methyltransferase A [Deltaproteobacteria bacterium]|nr:ribosomal RNA small subunit methyltransferase A [Deltaproteobacteria bacterium]
MKYLHPAALLRKYGFSPKKKLGQHFLADPHVAQKIVSLAHVGENDTLLEIGPGTGMLTSLLLTEAREVIAIERDRRMAEILQEEIGKSQLVADQGRCLRLVVADVLSVGLSRIFPDGKKCIVVANLPYNAATEILFHLFGFWDRIERMVLMFQKEVGDRILAHPGNKSYGALTLNVAYFAEVTKGFVVEPGSFLPPPAVHSMVLTFRHCAQTRHLPEWKLFRRFVMDAFARRRKFLINGLGQSETFGLTKGEWLKLFRDIGLSEKVRAEELSFEQYVELVERGLAISK